MPACDVRPYPAADRTNNCKLLCGCVTSLSWTVSDGRLRLADLQRDSGRCRVGVPALTGAAPSSADRAAARLGPASFGR